MALRRVPEMVGLADDPKALARRKGRSGRKKPVAALGERTDKPLVDTAADSIAAVAVAVAAHDDDDGVVGSGRYSWFGSWSVAGEGRGQSGKQARKSGSALQVG